MDKILKKWLKEYAKKRADDVDDVDIDELRRLVVDGAKWMYAILEENDK